MTILATVVVETGSATDEVIFEEFGGTANMELRLRRELAEAHTFPAVDIVASGTRQEALLSSEQEAGIVQSLRRRMSSEPDRPPWTGCSTRSARPRTTSSS